MCWRHQRTSKEAGGWSSEQGVWGVRSEGVARVQITTWTCYLYGPLRVIAGTRWVGGALGRRAAGARQRPSPGFPRSAPHIPKTLGQSCLLAAALMRIRD